MSTAKRARDTPVEELAFAVPPPALELTAVPLTKKSSKKAARAAAAAVKAPTRTAPAAAVDTPMEEEDAEEDADAAGETKDAGEEEEDDVPALSHKAARLLKKRKLSGLEPDLSVTALQASSMHPSRVLSLSGNVVAGRAGVQVKNGKVVPVEGVLVGNTPGKGAFGIWVGNMNFSTTNKCLLGWLEERGLKEVARINMPGGKRPGENNRGFAYVDFPTLVDVEVAVGLSEQHLDGRKLLIKASSDFTGRPASALNPVDPSSSVPTDRSAPASLSKSSKKILDRQKNSAGPTLFMGNLGFETTIEMIRELFDGHQRASAIWAAKARGEDAVTEGAVAEETVEEQGESKIVDEDRDEDDSDSESGSEESEHDDVSQVVADDSESESDEEEEDSAPAEEIDENADLTLLPVMEAPLKRVRAKTQAARALGAEGMFKQVKEVKDLSKAKDAGIRKVRLGTFEDTGKCKGWAFVDFHLPEQCTRALLNARNHSLDGRSLVVEYASPDAVRRGAIGTKFAVVRGASRGGRGGARGGSTMGSSRGGGNARGKGREWDDGDVETAAAAYAQPEGEAEVVEKAPRGQFGFRPDSARGGRGGAAAARGGGAPAARGNMLSASRGGVAGPRAKSGATLASAQRGSEAIVESTGKKITFE